RVLAHAEVVVRAPHHDVALAARRMPEGAREPAGEAFQVGEHAIAPLVPQAGEGVLEKAVVVHWASPTPPSPFNTPKYVRFLRRFPAYMSRPSSSRFSDGH